MTPKCVSMSRDDLAQSYPLRKTNNLAAVLQRLAQLLNIGASSETSGSETSGSETSGSGDCHEKP